MNWSEFEQLPFEDRISYLKGYNKWLKENKLLNKNKGKKNTTAT